MKENENEFSALYEDLYAEVQGQATSAINYNNSVADSEGHSDEDDLNIILNKNTANVDQVAGINSEADFNEIHLHKSAYEPKPWRRPGVDMTDYFNFGFDEDKWKRYCKEMQKGRAIHTKESSTGGQRQFEDLKYSGNGVSNVIQIVAPDSRKYSKVLNAEKFTIPKHSEYLGFKIDQNRSRFVDEGEYSSEREFSIETENGRHGRRRRREEEEDEELKWRNSFVREKRRGYDFRGDKFMRYFSYKGRIRNREDRENYSRPKFNYQRRRYNSLPHHFHNRVSNENRSWSSRYTSKRRLHCKTSPRYTAYDTHVRHWNQMPNRARFNGKNRYEERRVVQCRCKLTRGEENRSSRVDRSCHVVRRGTCERVARRCNDSADETVPKEKSTERSSEGGRTIPEKVEHKKSTSTSVEPHMDKVLEEKKPEIEENKNREEVIDEVENEALHDIEEGQIIPQDGSESSIDDCISSWFRDPISADDQSGFGSSGLWMI